MKKRLWSFALLLCMTMGLFFTSETVEAVTTVVNDTNYWVQPLSSNIRMYDACAGEVIDLSGALDLEVKGGFELYYQPTENAKKERIVCDSYSVYADGKKYTDDGKGKLVFLEEGEFEIYFSYKEERLAIQVSGRTEDGYKTAHYSVTRKGELLEGARIVAVVEATDRVQMVPLASSDTGELQVRFNPDDYDFEVRYIGVSVMLPEGYVFSDDRSFVSLAFSRYNLSGWEWKTYTEERATWQDFTWQVVEGDKVFENAVIDMVINVDGLCSYFHDYVDVSENGKLSCSFDMPSLKENYIRVRYHLKEDVADEYVFEANGKTEYTKTYEPGKQTSDTVKVVKRSEYKGNTTNQNSGNQGTSGNNSGNVNGSNCVENGWCDDGGKSYWYENSIKQGTYNDPQGVMGDGTVRGREIYDPVSDGWYWLDAVYDGAKAVNKEVWMPYIYQNEADWAEDEIRMNAGASGDMAEQVIREINNRSGKWVRYDANGKMYKGWYRVAGEDAKLYPEQEGNVYYYDPQTGLMAKGDVMIDGGHYYFDETTGALQY